MAQQHVSSAARRYAKALFELASESGRQDGVFTQIEALGKLAEDAEFRALLPDPRIESGPKAKAVLGALGNEVDPLVRGLIESLERRKRLVARPGDLQLHRELGILRLDARNDPGERHLLKGVVFHQEDT